MLSPDKQSEHVFVRNLTLLALTVPLKTIQSANDIVDRS